VHGARPNGNAQQVGVDGSLSEKTGYHGMCIGAADAFSFLTLDRPEYGCPACRAAMLFANCARSSAAVRDLAPGDGSSDRSG
jgi:hypothetical protein